MLSKYGLMKQGYNWEHKLTEKIEINEGNWLQHMERINCFLISEIYVGLWPEKKDWEDVGTGGKRHEDLKTDSEDGVNMCQN
jgi:hypothetical protein